MKHDRKGSDRRVLLLFRLYYGGGGSSQSDRTFNVLNRSAIEISECDLHSQGKGTASRLAGSEHAATVCGNQKL